MHIGVHKYVLETVCCLYAPVKVLPDAFAGA